jgi:four helix bundle protein
MTHGHDRRRPPRDFRQVRLYRLALHAGLEVFHYFRRFPEHEDQQELAGEIVKASRLVAVQVADAWETRRRPERCLGSLGNAAALAAEMLVLLDVALGLGYLDRTQRDALIATYTAIRRHLLRLAGRKRAPGRTPKEE